MSSKVTVKQASQSASERKEMTASNFSFINIFFSATAKIEKKRKEKQVFVLAAQEKMLIFFFFLPFYSFLT